jgi:hypothetical protein
LLRVPKRSKFNGCGVEIDEAERKRKFVEIATGKPVGRARFVEAYYRSTFEAWKNYDRTGQETHHVGYNPVQVLDTDKIFADFPEVHIVHVVRNPWSGFADTIKRPFPLSLERYTWIWNVNQHLALTYAKKYANNFHILRFEDLAESAANTMKTVLGEIGLPMSDHCLHPSFNRKRLEEVYPWGTIRTPTPAANVATANELSSEQKERIRVEASVMLPLFGYDRLYSEHLAG